MTLAEFTPVCLRLARQLRTEIAADDVRDYAEALAAYDRVDLAAAATAIAVEPGRRFFPSTAEWAERAKKTQRERLLAQPPDREPWRVECEGCDDTGWRFRTCDGEHRICGRAAAHGEHAFVEACDCRPTNRTYQRHHAPEAKPA